MVTYVFGFCCEERLLVFFLLFSSPDDPLLWAGCFLHAPRICSLPSVVLLLSVGEDYYFDVGKALSPEPFFYYYSPPPLLNILLKSWPVKVLHC